MQLKPFNIMVFPNGPICNMNCEYCYYKEKNNLYNNKSNMKMNYELLELFIKNYMIAYPGIKIPFIWQGGEPTLRGLEFFKKAVDLQKKFISPGKKYSNSIQTNGISLDKNWIRFLKKENFLVGLSLDGPKNIHRKYRTDNKGNSNFRKIINNLKQLKKYNIETNILCVVNKKNIKKASKIYYFFKKLNIDYIQFIPLVDLKKPKYSIDPINYADFLITIFNEWIKDGYGKLHIQIFEEILNAWFNGNTNICYFKKECGDTMVLEHNGDLYSCDHFVNKKNKLGNIKDNSLKQLVTSSKQNEFGKNKINNLSNNCKKCEYYFICHGGCLKNRIKEKDYENYLCEGYKKIFEYTEPYMKIIVKGIKNKFHPSEIQKNLLSYNN